MPRATDSPWSSAVVSPDELDRVGEGVAVVEEEAVALLPFVAADDVGLDLDAPGRGRADGVRVAADDSAAGALQVAEQVRGADEGVLGDLGQARLEPPPGVGAGHLDVADHDDGLVDGADQVAAEAQVDRVLAADGGVGLGRQRRRHQAQPHAAVERRRHEAGDVDDGLPAHRDHQVVSVHGVIGERVGQVLGRGEGLRRLGVGQGDAVDGDARGLRSPRPPGRRRPRPRSTR